MRTAAISAKWSVVEYGGLALISFGSLVVYARFLSAAEFGLFAVALAVIELLAVAVGMMFHDALVQRRDIAQLHYDTAFTATLALSAAVIALCWAIAPVVSEKAAMPDAGLVLLWLSASLPLTAVSATVIARRRRELDFRALAVSSIAGRAAGAAAGIALVVAGFGVWGLVIQHVLFVLVQCLVLWARPAGRPSVRFGVAEFRQLIGFGAACVSDLLLNFLTKRLFIVVSGSLLGAHAAGLLSLAFRVFDTLWAVVATGITQISLPLMSALQADKPRFERAFRATLPLVCLIAYFVFVLLAVAAPEVVTLVFGPRWAPAAPYVTLLCLQVVSGAVRAPVSAALKALGRPRDLVACQAAELAFLAGAVALFGLPTIGWAVGIWLAREAIGSLLQAWLFTRATGMSAVQFLGGTAVPLLAAGGMFAAVAACRALFGSPVWVLVPAGALVYFALVALLQKGLLMELMRFIRAAFHRVQAVPT